MTGEDAGALPETVACKRKRKDGNVCEAEIPLIKENLKITKPEVPLISAVCPECGLYKILDGPTSKKVAELYFKDEIEAALVKKGLPAAGAGSGAAGLEETAGGMRPPPPSMGPAEDTANRVVETLYLLGYKIKSWEDKIEAIRELIKSTVSFQTAEGVRTLLQAMAIDPIKAHIAIQRAFHGTDVVQQMQLLQTLGTTMSGQDLQYLGAGQSPFIQSPSGQLPVVRMTPGGPVIVMPAQPASSPAHEDRGDEVVVEERLDAEGKVKARIIRGPRDRVLGSEDDSFTRLTQTISLLKEMGVVRGGSEPPRSSETAALAEVANRLAELVENREEGGKEDRISDVMKEITAMREENRVMKESAQRDQQDAVVSKVTMGLENLSNRMVLLERKFESPGTIPGASEVQVTAQNERENLKTVVTAIERVSDKFLDPLVEMNKRQMALQGLLNVRQMAYQDGVPPFLYLRTLEGGPEPDRAEVEAQVDNWRKRQAAIEAAQKAAEASAAAAAAAVAGSAAKPESRTKKLRFAGSKE